MASPSDTRSLAQAQIVGKMGVYESAGAEQTSQTLGIKQFQRRSTNWHTNASFHGSFCFFSDALIAFRNCSTAGTLGAFNASFAL